MEEAKKRKKISRAKDVLVLTNSSADTFTDCNERYRLSVIEGWRPKTAPRALSFGSLYHLMMQHYWETIGISCAQHPFETREEAESFFSECFRGIAEESVEKVSEAEGATAEDVDAAVEDANLCYEIACRYARKNYADDVSRWEVLAVEKRLTRTLPTESGNPSYTEYSGVLDVLLRDKRDGGVYIMDHKTTSNDKPSHLKAEFMMSQQPLGYVWLVAQRCEELYGEPVRGFIYDVVRKKLPAVPAPLKRRTDGRALSISKDVDTMYDVFARAIEEHDPGNEAAYSDLLQRLQERGDVFLWRYKMSVGEEDVGSWVRDRRVVAENIRASVSKYGSEKAVRKSCGDVHFMRNYQSCFKLGRRCPFVGVCLDKSSPEGWEMFTNERGEGDGAHGSPRELRDSVTYQSDDWD